MRVQKVTALEAELAKQQGVNEELSTELREAGNYAELNHTIHDLDAQLETSRRSEQHATQRLQQLEAELDALKSLEQVRTPAGTHARSQATGLPARAEVSILVDTSRTNHTIRLLWKKML